MPNSALSKCNNKALESSQIESGPNRKVGVHVHLFVEQLAGGEESK